MSADPRFKVRGPYWSPGCSVLAEPWVALGESSVGHRVVRHGRHPDRALRMIETWRLRGDQGGPIDTLGVVVVSAAVVNPRGEITASWARGGAVAPVPGGQSRWSPLGRVATPLTCLGCGAERWPGCWVRRDQRGCSACLPELEAADPRVWPFEPPAPGKPVAVVRVKTPKVSKARKAVQVVSPAGDRLL